MHDSTIALSRVLRTPSLVPPASAPAPIHGPTGDRACLSCEAGA